MHRHLRLTLLAAVLVAGCGGPARSTAYPAHWWAPADDVRSWEIAPAAAASGAVILSKRNELGLLSNFAPTPFTLDGVRYASVEGFWQMMKYPEGPEDPRTKAGPWPHTRAEVAAMTAFEAKDAGKAAGRLMKQLGITWCTYQGERIRYKGDGADRHYALIRRAMAAKLAGNADVRAVLRATGDLELLPDHRQSRSKTRAYDYHRIWMDLRKTLSARDDFLPGWSAENRRRILRAVGAGAYRSYRVAVFDGDGTLWHSDIPREFLSYAVGKRRLKHFDYSQKEPVATLYRTCRSDVSICIAQAAFLFSGLSLETIRTDAAAFFAAHLDTRVFGPQKALITYLRSRGFDLWVVSGGPHWLAAAAAQRYFAIAQDHVIGVRTRIVAGVLTAQVVPPLPFRAGKARAIQKLVGKAPLIVVGNSKSDIPMLETAQLLSIAVASFGADHPGFHYKSEQTLKAEAQRRGWAVQWLGK